MSTIIRVLSLLVGGGYLGLRRECAGCILQRNSFRNNLSFSGSIYAVPLPFRLLE